MISSSILNDLVTRIAEAGRSLALGSSAQSSDPIALCERLLSGKGEATGLAIAQQVLDAYGAFEPAERVAFFRQLKDRFGVDIEVLEQAVADWRTKGPAAARALHFASEPRSQELIRRLNRAPGGTQALVGMRADLLDAAKEDADLQALDTDFQHLLASWFNRGFLELRRIDWQTPASINWREKTPDPAPTSSRDSSFRSFRALCNRDSACRASTASTCAAPKASYLFRPAKYEFIEWEPPRTSAHPQRRASTR